MELPPPPAIVVEAPISDLQEQISQVNPEQEGREMGQALSELLDKGTTLDEAMKILVAKYPNLIMDIHIPVGASVQGQSAGGAADIILKGDGAGGFSMYTGNVSANSSQISISNGNDIIRQLLNQPLSGNASVSINASGMGQRMNGIPGHVNEVVIGISDGDTHLGQVTKHASRTSFTYSNYGAPEVAEIPANIPMHISTPVVSPQGNSGLTITPVAREQLTQAMSSATGIPLPVARTTNSGTFDSPSEITLSTPVGTPEFSPAIFNMNSIPTIAENLSVDIQVNQPFILKSHTDIILVIYSNSRGALRVEALNSDGTIKSVDTRTPEEEKFLVEVYSRLRFTPGSNKATIDKA